MGRSFGYCQFIGIIVAVMLLFGYSAVLAQEEQDQLIDNFNLTQDEFSGSVKYFHRSFAEAPLHQAVASLLIVKSSETEEPYTLSLIISSRSHEWLFPETVWFKIEVGDESYNARVDAGRYDEYTIIYDNEVTDSGLLSEDVGVYLCDSNEMGYMKTSELKAFMEADNIRIRVDGDRSEEAYVHQQAFMETISLFLMLTDNE